MPAIVFMLVAGLTSSLAAHFGARLGREASAVFWRHSDSDRPNCYRAKCVCRADPRYCVNARRRINLMGALAAVLAFCAVQILGGNEGGVAAVVHFLLGTFDATRIGWLVGLSIAPAFRLALRQEFMTVIVVFVVLLVVFSRFDFLLNEIGSLAVAVIWFCDREWRLARL